VRRGNRAGVFPELLAGPLLYVHLRGVVAW
jgi:hypothetical protein